MATVLKSGRGGRRSKHWVPQIELPPTSNAIDGLVNALVAAWNAQPHDQAARDFFALDLTGRRQRLIADSLYRWPERQDQQFIAGWLAELARAIQGGCFRWNS